MNLAPQPPVDPAYPLAHWRAAFPALRRTHQGQPLVFLDGPSGSQVPQPVLEAVVRTLAERSANTHGAFPTSQAVDRLLVEARAAVADVMGAPSGRCIAFGANMTSLNFALTRALARDLREGDEVVVTELDHDANVAPWLLLEERGVVVRTARMDPERGELDRDHLAGLLGPRTRWLAVGWASNALGTVNPVAELVAQAHAVGAGVVVDAVHWAPHGPMDVQALGAEFVLASAYKFFGPHVGVLYGAPHAFARLRPDRVRPQHPEPPECIETGTLNHEGIAGVHAAVDFLADMSPLPPSQDRRTRLLATFAQIYAHEHALAAWLWQALEGIPGVRLYGPPVGEAVRAPTLSFTVGRLPARAVAQRLGAQGIQVGDGDFYAVQVVERLGLAGRGGLVRVGLAPYTDPSDLSRLVAAVAEVARHPA